MVLALSGHNYLLDKLKTGNFNGVVHSTFRRTINIRNLIDGEIYTIATNRIDNAPNTLIIDKDSLDDCKIEVGDKVISDSRLLYIENHLIIDLTLVKEWEMQLQPYPERASLLQRNVSVLKKYLYSNGSVKSFIYDSPNLLPFEVETNRLLKERTNLLIQSLEKNDLNNAFKTALSLVGLGPGLTPSGDDFLVGLFTVIHMHNSPLKKYRPLCQKIVEESFQLTNEISYYALKQASISQVRESINHLLREVVHGEELSIIQAANQVLAIGSSSGTDITLGLIAGLELTIKLEVNDVYYSSFN